MDNNWIFKVKKKLDIIKHLCKGVVILKPDKENGIILVRNSDYYNTLEKLLPDRTNLKQIEEDPTPARLTSIQRCLEQLKKRGESPDAVFKEIHSQHA